MVERRVETRTRQPRLAAAVTRRGVLGQGVAQPAKSPQFLQHDPRAARLLPKQLPGMPKPGVPEFH